MSILRVIHIRWRMVRLINMTCIRTIEILIHK